MLYMRLFLLIWLAFVFGCSPRSANLTLPFEPPKAFSSHASQALSERWWTAFGDARMDSLVDRALQSNFNLETAWHRLRSAQAVVDREGAGRFPTLEVSGRGEVQRPDSENNAQIRLGITSEYEIDLWGRIHSDVDAARYRMRATEADYQTAALSLSAEVARTYFQLMEAQNQHELFEHQIETNQQVLSLIRARFGSGQIRSVDILRQRQLIESTREQKIATESRIEVLEHQLAVLSGYAPQDGIAYTHRALPDLPPLPDTGLPVELIQRRPDVKRAYNLLLAADRDVAVAISNRYPRLSLTALASGDDRGGLFKDWVGNLIGNLLLPVIDGGERGAEIRRNQANQSAQLSAYGQTVLTAFAEVENALVQEQKQIERIASLEAQVALVRQTYDQLRLEYLNGISDYLDVLTALTNEQRLRRALISAKLDLLEFRIALYRALAGGFEIARNKSL
ncbi:MAG: TolC family protein [Gemmatimonadota bacterium]|nr:TolC family protein [Gemmatimonadota bacterium]